MAILKLQTLSFLYNTLNSSLHKNEDLLHSFHLELSILLLKSVEDELYHGKYFQNKVIIYATLTTQKTHLVFSLSTIITSTFTLFFLLWKASHSRTHSVHSDCLHIYRFIYRNCICWSMCSVIYKPSVNTEKSQTKRKCAHGSWLMSYIYCTVEKCGTKKKVFAI